MVKKVDKLYSQVTTALVNFVFLSGYFWFMVAGRICVSRNFYVISSTKTLLSHYVTSGLAFSLDFQHKYVDNYLKMNTIICVTFVSRVYMIHSLLRRITCSFRHYPFLHWVFSIR